MAVTTRFLGPFNNREVCNEYSILHECQSDHGYDIIILVYGLHASLFSWLPVCQCAALSFLVAALSPIASTCTFSRGSPSTVFAEEALVVCMASST
jgi:hypothetical protein